MIALLLAALLAQEAAPTDKEGEAAAHKLRDDAAKSSIDGKIAALQEALKTEHALVIKAVGEMLVSEADPVRIAGAAALANVDHPASAEVLTAALLPNLRREEVMPALLKALGDLGWQSPVGRLNDLLTKVGDADVRAILPSAIQALGQLGSPTSIDPLIDLLQKLEGPRRNPWPNEGPLRRGAEEALRTITGLDFRRVTEWDPWWRANQEIFRNKQIRTYWLKKTQDRIDLQPGEKTPADALLVASRLHSAQNPLVPPGKKRKKKS